MRRGRTTERLVALFLLGLILLMPPVVSVFNHEVRVLGIPLLYLYLYAAWALLIVLAAAAARSIDQADNASAQRPDPENRRADRPADETRDA